MNNIILVFITSQGPASVWENFFNSLNWKPYDVMEVDIYGLAPKGGVIKGRRITGRD